MKQLVWSEIEPFGPIRGFKGRLWLRGRASVLLSKGRWFDSPGLHVRVSLGKILNPKPWCSLCIKASAKMQWMCLQDHDYTQTHIVKKVWILYVASSYMKSSQTQRETLRLKQELHQKLSHCMRQKCCFCQWSLVALERAMCRCKGCFSSHKTDLFWQSGVANC